MNTNFFRPVWAIGLFAATSLPGTESARDPITELEAFIVEETAQTQLETLSPVTSRVDSIFGDNLSVVEIPRALTVLSPELRDLLQINSYEALDRFGAGTQRVNYFGLAGSAFLRGSRAGTYFNGMLRAYQRNEMPMSFGALEALELIKGPVPASLSPTLVGGAVNQRPKSPYFDRSRGSVEFTVGSWDERELQLDYGAPLLLLGKPAAYRFSYTGHRSDRFYENVPNDFDSVYFATKIKLSARHRLFVGGEIYDFRSSEIPGVNRPTRELIRSGQYVIGEPPSLTSSEWGGQVVRPLLEFPTFLDVNPALFALAIPGEIARARIDPSLLSTMLDLSDPEAIASLYAVDPDSPAAPFMAQVEKSPQDAYLYTPEYLAAGGEVLTTQLPRERVLADPDDKSDSRDYLAFADLETRLDNGDQFLARLFLEHLETEKASTYGFAFDHDQLVIETRLEYRTTLGAPRNTLAVGVNFRYTEAEVLQDFDAEPFSRRDLGLNSISANSRVPAGGMRGPDRLNFWSSFGTASIESGLFQGALYASGTWALGNSFVIYYGARAEEARYDGGLPDTVDRVFSEREAFDFDGTEFLWQLHLNPHLEVVPGVFVYGALQMGKALAPGDGGTVSGPDSFTDVELFEGGIKADLLDSRLYSSLSFYHWDQATFSTRDASARPLRAKGIEWEFTWAPSEILTLLGSFTAQRVNLRSDTLGFGTIPQTEAGWALNGGILNATAPRTAPDNPDMIFAGLPEVSAHLYAALELPLGFQISGGPLWRDGYSHDMQRSLRIPSHVLWTAQLHYKADNWWARLHVDNVFDKDYWIGQEPVFAAGTLILQGTGRRFRLSVGMEF